MWSTHPVYCENVTFKNVVFHSGADGIDVDSCRHVIIDGCDISRPATTASRSSRGAARKANAINRPCEDVHIPNCTFNDKTLRASASGARLRRACATWVIEHCKCVGARSHAIYIKSRPGRGAFIENITVDDFEASGARQGFLRLNNLNSGKQDEFPVPGDAGIPLFREFHFSNIRVTDLPMLVQATEIHPSKPLDGFHARPM